MEVQQLKDGNGGVQGFRGCGLTQCLTAGMHEEPLGAYLGNVLVLEMLVWIALRVSLAKASSSNDVCMVVPVYAPLQGCCGLVSGPAMACCAWSTVERVGVLRARGRTGTACVCCSGAAPCATHHTCICQNVQVSGVSLAFVSLLCRKRLVL